VTTVAVLLEFYRAFASNVGATERTLVGILFLTFFTQ